MLLSFGIVVHEMIPRDHTTDCYFSFSNISVMNRKNKASKNCGNIGSPIRPTPHSARVPVPKHPANFESNVSSNSCSDSDENFSHTQTLQLPQQSTQSEPNDLVRDLEFKKMEQNFLVHG